MEARLSNLTARWFCESYRSAALPNIWYCSYTPALPKCRLTSSGVVSETAAFVQVDLGPKDLVEGAAAGRKVESAAAETGESKLSAQLRYCSRFPLLCDCSSRNGMLRYLVSRMNNRVKIDLHAVCLFAVLAKIESA
jgi:hypothetical protein